MGRAGSLCLPTHGPGLVITFRPRAIGILISFDQRTLSERSVHVFLEHTRTHAYLRAGSHRMGITNPRNSPL